MRNEFDYMDGPQSGEGSFDLSRIWQLLRRRRWPILITTAIALIPASVVPFILPAIYQSTASVSLQPKPEVLEIGADLESSGPMRQVQMVESMASLVRSSAVLGRIIDQLPPESMAKQAPTGLLARATAALGLAEEGDEMVSPDQLRQLRVQHLQGAIEVSGAGGGTVLAISASGTDPVHVTFLANATADALVDYRRDQHSAASRKALAWLNEQTYELRTRIDSRRDAIDKLLAETGIDGDGEGSQRRAKLESQVSGTEIELQATRRRLAELRSSIESQAAVAVETEQKRRLIEQHREARAALEAARLSYTATHPQVRRLEAVERSLAEKIDPRAHAGSASPVDTDELRKLEAQETRLRAQLGGLKNGLTSLAQSNAAGADAQNQYDRMTRELTIDRQMLEVLLTRRNETMLSAASEHPGVLVLDYAVPPSVPIRPQRKLLLLLGIVGACGLGVGLGVLLELLDRRVREPEEVSELLEVPMLALVPASGPADTRPERQCAQAAGAPASEAYRNLRTSLLFSMSRMEVSTLLVTSAVAGEGKTTVSSNLAASFSLMGRKVLLVDADMRRARLHRVFDLSRSPGLSEVLRGAARLEDAVQRPEGAEFDVLTAGSLPDNPSELVTSPKRDLVMARMRNQYDLIVLDSPVLLAVSDALILSADADATLLVHKLGSVDRRGLTRVNNDLKRAGANVLGIVFNQIDTADPYIYPAYMESPYHEEPDSRSWRRRRSGKRK